MTLARLLTAACLFALAACSAQRPASPPSPAPLPRRVAVPAPVPLPQPPPAPASWMDAPATPGDWSYRAVATGSQALFGTPGSAPLLIFACNRAARQVELMASVANARPAPMRVLTELSQRLIETRAPGDGQALLTASLPARDPLLDSIAFSKGRFAVEIAGEPTLYLPSWPEISRVIEDCR